jgi:asparagine synthase (glutamine-hydrolysing)
MAANRRWRPEMLKLRIETACIAGRWSYRDGAWTNGASTIVPFAHRTIESFAVDLPDRQLIVIRENPSAHLAAKSDAPRFGAGDPAAAIAALLDWPLNVVVVSMPLDGIGAVEIHTGLLVTVPLFLAQSGARLIGGWDVADFYSDLPLRLDTARAAFLLCHFGLPYSRRTVFHDVLRLTDRATAIWDARGRTLEVRYPPPLLRAMPRRLKEGADVLGAFEDLIGAVIRRAANGSTIASELSGGLDSGVATMVAARVLGADRVRSFGLLLPGVQKQPQQARRIELADLAGVIDTGIDSDNLGPFSQGGMADTDPAIPWGEYYREAFLAVARSIAVQGCDIVVRGIGGDEISELTIDEVAKPDAPRKAEAEAAPFPSYLSEEAKGAYADLTDLDEAPYSHAPTSFAQSVAASAPCYLRHGIWPIYPYGVPEVIDFCRSLPLEWRADRTLQRSLLRAAGLSAQVARPDKPESFLPLRDRMFTGPAAAYVRDILRDPLLAELGLVDARALAQSFECAVRDEASPERGHLLEAVTMETVLRTCRQKSQALGP